MTLPPPSVHRKSPGRHNNSSSSSNISNSSNNIGNNTINQPRDNEIHANGKTAEEILLLRRKQRKKRRRPPSGNSGSNNNSINNNNNNSTNGLGSRTQSPMPGQNRTGASGRDASPPSPPQLPSCLNDPFQLIAIAVDHDENKRNGLEVLQVPLESGKLYHNEGLFFRALDHLLKETRALRFGYSRPLPPPPRSSDSEGKEPTPNRWKASRAERVAVTPIILSGLLACLDGNGVASRIQRCSNPACTKLFCASASASEDGGDRASTKANKNTNKNKNTNASTKANTNTNTTESVPRAAAAAATPDTTSAELVNYTVGMRRAAMARVRLRMKRDRFIKVAKPVLAFLAVLVLYWYAWSNFRLLLIGVYGVAEGGDPSAQASGRPQQLVASSCRGSHSHSPAGSSVHEYERACRIAEAGAFRLLASIHNHRHTTLFARAVSDWIATGAAASERTRPALDGASDLGDGESLDRLALALAEYDDVYQDDTELPLYAMHTLLADEESSRIPLEDVLYTHYRKQPQEPMHRERWKRRRRRKKKYQHSHRNKKERDVDGSRLHDALPAHERLALAVQFWGDTAVNRLVRDAIVEAQHEHHAPPSQHQTPATTKSHKHRHQKKGESNPNDQHTNEMKLLDVGSGVAGTLFSLCAPEFPFSNWSYHGIAISQPEVRRAKQLLATAVRPALLSETSAAGGSEGLAFPSGTPLTNVTIRQASFDDPLPPNEYTAMVAVESLAHSNNITKTLVNLASSLKPKGTLVVIEDVVAPWVQATGRNETAGGARDNDQSPSSGSSAGYLRSMADLSAKPSLKTHEEWLGAFSSAGLVLHRPPRDLALEFDTLPEAHKRSATASTVTGLPFIGMVIGEKPWYASGHGLLKKRIEWFGTGSGDDGSIAHRALLLTEDLLANDRGNSYRKALYNRGDLGYYMYVCTKK
ncbi:unnamed protein product [Pseudo-nitzschia multistriata]|uniref:Methyltransferase type 12 domain-containing protein n=1 Tax=Pseudo-nitzschia multistriata TaxID=183589 RepID=A0A448ZSR3_9STRA|nr:unnamed protein product [Pseudo-nitzschia multistriata]